VCGAHHAAMEAGDPWLFDGTERVFYVGADLRARGLRRVTGISVQATRDRLNDLDGLQVLTIFYATVGSDDPDDSIELVMDRHLQAYVARMLAGGDG
jgi:hypothetical protein